MITLPGVAVYISRFLARRASLGNHSFLFQRGNVEGTALGEKMSLLPFDPPACLENEEKKKKPRNLETFNVESFWIGGPNSFWKLQKLWDKQLFGILGSWNAAASADHIVHRHTYSRNRHALATLVTTTSAYRNLKVTAVNLYIALPWRQQHPKKNRKKLSCWDLRTPLLLNLWLQL